MPRKKKQKRVKGIASSKPEKEIKMSLEKLGFKIKTQFPIDKFKFDLMVEGTNFLIEYNGDYFHMNPNIYNKNDQNKKLQMSAQQIWDKDQRKNNIAKEKGYQILVIWEKDFKEHKKEIIKEMVKILNK